MPVEIKRLRAFGLILGVLLGLWGGQLLRTGRPALTPWLFGSAGLLALTALLRPGWLAGVYGPWMRAARFIARLNTYLVLAIVYYLLLTPYALIRRLAGDDPLQLGVGKRPSDWQRKQPRADLDAYERQF